MLAKEIKIKNLKQQREFIESELKCLSLFPRNDGDPSYLYIGNLFPEVSEYFEQRGFDVSQVMTLDGSSEVLTDTGYPVYLFTISDELILNGNELKEAEEVEIYLFLEDITEEEFSEESSDSVEDDS